MLEDYTLSCENALSCLTLGQKENNFFLWRPATLIYNLSMSC